MLVIHASPDHTIDDFITLIEESNCDFTINSYVRWQQNNPQEIPEGFIYIQVAPEITIKKLAHNNICMTLDQAQATWSINEDYFIKNNRPSVSLQNVPVLLLNGNIHFKDDFSQFYTHLFAIKKFFQTIKDAHNKAMGIYIEPRKKHSSCKC